ncbi:MAG: hypothetical protein F4X26_01465 [Chloroflexi bacterium]|nr:hypothetical protein [Chloroflexota bacterium]
MALARMGCTHATPCTSALIVLWNCTIAISSDDCPPVACHGDWSSCLATVCSISDGVSTRSKTRK